MIELARRFEDGAERHRCSDHPPSARSDHRSRAGCGDYRAVGQREVDPARPARGPRCTVGGHVVLDGVDITALDEDSLARLRGRRIGFVFQFFHLLPSLTALRERARADGDCRRCRMRRRARKSCSPKSVWPIAPTTIRRSCRAANSSGSRLHGPWPTTRPSCSPTSPPAISTAPPASQVIQLLLDVNRTRKTTLVLVTHDPGLAGVADVVDCASRRTRRADDGAGDGGGRGIMTFVLQMIARELRSSVAAAPVLLRLCRYRRRRHRRAALGDPERARPGLMSEARSIIAADVLFSTNRRVDRRVLARARTTARGPDDVLERMDAIETATMVRRNRARPRRGWWSCAACSRVSVLRRGHAAGRAALLARSAARPRRAGEAGAADPAWHPSRRTRIVIGGQPFTIRGVIAQEPGRRVGAFSFGSRVLIDYDDLRATGLLTFGSRASYQMLLRVREQAVEPSDPRPSPGLPRPVRPGALLPVDRGRHRRGPDARRELSEPGRLHHGRARRHRRLERHARVRQAEDPQRRDPEMRGRDRRTRSWRPTSRR